MSPDCMNVQITFSILRRQPAVSGYILLESFKQSIQTCQRLSINLKFSTSYSCFPIVIYIL